jgi:hypothetical protein
MMKHLLFIAAFFIAAQTFAQGDEDYAMYNTIYIKTKTDMVEKMMHAMKSHNDNFHNEDGYRANVWRVISGERSGGIVWVMGPLMWKHMDNLPGGADHATDWVRNVLPLAKSIGDEGFWRRMDGLTYTPENSDPKVMRVRYLDVEPGEFSKVSKMAKDVFAVYNKEKYNSGIHMFSNQMDV